MEHEQFIYVNINKLLYGGFICEVQDPNLLTNHIIVPKVNGKV